MKELRKVAYKRVSTKEQNTDRQLGEMEFDIEFVEKITGKNLARPKLQEMLREIKAGDSIYVHSLDRLGRSLRDLLEVVEKITKKGVKITFVKENLEFGDKDSPYNALMLSLLGAVAQFELSMIRSRQREGIDKALKRDAELRKNDPNISRSKLTYKGNKGLDPAKAVRIRELCDAGFTSGPIHKVLNISRTTVRKYRAMSDEDFKKQLKILNEAREKGKIHEASAQK